MNDPRNIRRAGEAMLKEIPVMRRTSEPSKPLSPGEGLKS
jgi:hypothetical protein